MLSVPASGALTAGRPWAARACRFVLSSGGSAPHVAGSRSPCPARDGHTGNSVREGGGVRCLDPGSFRTKDAARRAMSSRLAPRAQPCWTLAPRSPTCPRARRGFVMARPCQGPRAGCVGPDFTCSVPIYAFDTPGTSRRKRSSRDKRTHARWARAHAKGRGRTGTHVPPTLVGTLTSQDGRADCGSARQGRRLQWHRLEGPASWDEGPLPGRTLCCPRDEGAHGPPGTFIAKRRVVAVLT